jgi:hypothetical protein
MYVSLYFLHDLTRLISSIYLSIVISLSFICSWLCRGTSNFFCWNKSAVINLSFYCFFPKFWLIFPHFSNSEFAFIAPVSIFLLLFIWTRKHSVFYIMKTSTFTCSENSGSSRLHLSSQTPWAKLALPPNSDGEGERHPGNCPSTKIPLGAAVPWAELPLPPKGSLKLIKFSGPWDFTCDTGWQTRVRE